MLGRAAASSTMQCGIEIEKTFEKAGVPQGVFQTAVGDSSIADILIDSDGVNTVTFTGSYYIPVGCCSLYYLVSSGRPELLLLP
jgi:acyl-CoA reductase-like NAD-dependent aldehyde dehydrogenase